MHGDVNALLVVYTYILLTRWSDRSENSNKSS